jgi:hypothetical protein
MKIIKNIDVKYTYHKPVSSALLSAVRNKELLTGKLVIEKEGDFFNILLYEKRELIAHSSLDFFYHENFIDGGNKGPVYLNLDLSDLREELYAKIGDIK